jgi:hypothetical protein
VTRNAPQNPSLPKFFRELIGRFSATVNHGSDQARILRQTKIKKPGAVNLFDKIAPPVDRAELSTGKQFFTI